MAGKWVKNWEAKLGGKLVEKLGGRGRVFSYFFFLLGKSASDDESESESLMPNGNVRTFKKCTKNGDEHFR